MAFKFLEAIFISFFKVLSAIITLVPTLIEIKNIPINAIATAFGVPVLVISLILFVYKKIKKLLS